MLLKGTNQEQGRPFNRRIVLEAVRQHGPITRVDIAKRVGLTLQTVSTITSELHEQGFLVLRRGAPKGRGFPAPMLEVNPEGGFACGIHLTPLGLEGGLINIAGEVIACKSVGIPHMSSDAAFEEIAQLVEALVAHRPNGRILGVGMAMPGPFDIESMSFVGPTTMEGWQGVAVHERLQAAVRHPAFIEVDSAAAAHGERLYGTGERLRNFYYLHLGVGLGGCVIYDGQVVRGAWGNAGEIGHVPLVPDGDPCPCGNRGCLERYVSLEAYERRTAEIGEAAWLTEIAPVFRSAVVTIENLFDPEAIVLGGIASTELRRKILEAVGELPNSTAARRDRRIPRLVLSATGPDAVLRGAAALAVAHVLSPRFGRSARFPAGAEASDPFMKPLEQERAL